MQLFKLNERNEGEICTRGRCTAMGYLFDQAKTLDTFDEEGWLHTGDLGTLDSDGFYFIVGRIKEIIITAGGENIAPVNIEDEVKKELEAVVSNIMVVGEKRRFLSSLITLRVKPDPETLIPTSELEDVARSVLTNHRPSFSLLTNPGNGLERSPGSVSALCPRSWICSRLMMSRDTNLPGETNSMLFG